MSDFGLFESDEAAGLEPRVAARTAARKLDAAIDEVRAKFGRFLLGATGIDEFGDRWHYSKQDIRKTVEPYVFPNTGTMRRIQNAMKQDWKLAHPYKLAEGIGDVGGSTTQPSSGIGNVGGPATGVSGGGTSTWAGDAGRGLPGNLGDGAVLTDPQLIGTSPGLPDLSGDGGNMTDQFSSSSGSGMPQSGTNAPSTPSGGGATSKMSRRRQALSHEEAGFGSMPESDHPKRNQHLEKTYHPSDGNLIPKGNFHEWKDSVDQDGPEKVSEHDFTPGGDSGSAKHSRRMQAGGSQDRYDAEDAHEDMLRREHDQRVVDEGRRDGTLDEYTGPTYREFDGYEASKKEAARLVADIYTDFAQSNGLRVASLDTLDTYAETGIHEADYRLLQSMIIATAAEDCDEDCDDDDSDEDTDSEASEASESDDDSDSDSEDEAPDFGGSEDDEDDTDGDGDHDDDDHHGGQSFTVPDQAPELSPQMMGEIPQDDTDGSAPIPPEVVDSLLGLPEGTIEQLLLEEVSGGQGAPQGGGGNFFGGGGAFEPPRVARRRQSAFGQDDMTDEEMWSEYERQREDKIHEHQTRQHPSGVNIHTFRSTGEAYDKSQYLDNIKHGDILSVPSEKAIAVLDQAWPIPLTHEGGAFGEFKSDDHRANWHAKNGGEMGGSIAAAQDESARTGIPLHPVFGGGGRQAARRFWAAEGDDQNADGGGGQPAQDPAAAGGDPAAMMGQMGGGQMLPPPGSAAIQPPAPPAPIENQPAEDQLLDMASQAISQMIDRETAEYQQIIDPLSQALQAVQFAQQVEQAEHPLDVTPPQGTVNVDPSQAPAAQANPMQQQASRQFWAAEEGKKLCYHPRSCQKCDSRGGACGAHVVGSEGHERCSGSGGRQAKRDEIIRKAAYVIARRHGLSEEGHRMLLAATFGRRDYEHIVEALRLVPVEARQAPATHITHLLAAGNPRLNKDVFMKTVMASNPRDRAWDAWASGRDRGDAEHARHDMEDEGDDYTPEFMRRDNEQHHDDYGSLYSEYVNRRYEGSRGRLPFDRPRRTAGETWVHHSIPDTFEFENDVPQSRDNMTINDLPKIPGGHVGSSQKVVDRFQRWQNYRQQQGLPAVDGEAGIHNFLQTTKPYKSKVGDEAAAILHREKGLQPDTKAAPRVKVPKAVNPALKGKGTKTPKAPIPKAPKPKAAPKTASFFTRRVPGWRWDDHLNGYISKEGRDFTCSCGQKVAAPSYKSCDCGKIWNVYAIGDTHHLASDTADMFIAREIPVRDNVIMANRKMAGGQFVLRPPEDDDDPDNAREVSKFRQRSEADASDMNILWRLLHDKESNRKTAKDGECTCWEGYERVPGTEPCASGSCRKKKAEAAHRELLAVIDRYADWTKYDDVVDGQDPVAQAYGKTKVPSTKSPKIPRDWAKRNPDGKWKNTNFAPKKK